MSMKISILLSCFFALQISTSDRQNVIHVAVEGLRSDKGQVLCSLYASAAGYPKNDTKAIAHAKSLINGGHADCEFSGIQAGTIAISVFHDENSNGRLDTNFLGIPREGVGASNNAKGRFGPPSFHDASVAYSGGHMDLKIVITYL